MLQPTGKQTQQNSLKLSQKLTSISLLPSIISPKSRQMNSIILDSLNDKFNNLKSKIDQKQIHNEKLYFNLMKWQKDRRSRMNDDPQVAISKLKQIEDNLEMNRASAELQKRSRSKKKPKINFSKISKLNSQMSYKQQYQNVQKYLESLNNNNDDTEIDDSQLRTYRETGILHYHELKKRPKLLQYVSNRINQSKISSQFESQNSQKNMTRIDEIQIKRIKKEYEDTVNIIKNNNIQHNPQLIVSRQYAKFFTSKRNHPNIREEMKSLKSCQKLIKKQELLKSKEMTTQNQRKLMQKFNHIVKQIAKTQRYGNPKIQQQKISPFKFPKITNKH